MFHGSTSVVRSKCSTNVKRNESVQTPWHIKIYAFNIFLLGSSAAIQFDSQFKSPVYAYQRFSLNAWNNFRISGSKLDRAKCSFKKNPDIAAVLQKTPILFR